MKFPSWQEFTEKISEFDKSVNATIGKRGQGFQDKHPLGDKAVKTIISLLPPPFNAMAENIYAKSEGSDEEKFEKIKEFLVTIQEQWEEHYNSLSVKSDAIIQEVLSLQDITAKESTLQLVMKMMIAQSDATSQQLEHIKERLTKTQTQQIGGDQIGYWVRGDNNIIGKNISVINQEIKPSGLTLLEPDYFERRKNVKDDFENWKKGYAFELPSIYYGYEFRRKNVTDEIKQKLEANNKLLMLGESGTSKSTVLMEITCDYFTNGYKVLHNLDSTQLPQANDIVQYIEPLVKGKNKLLIAIDNAHDKKMSTIFNVINQLSFIDNSKDILLLVTARLPEYDTLVSKRLLELDDRDRIALKKFNEIPNIKYPIPYFRDAKEVEEFFTFYKTRYNLEKSSIKSYSDIFKETSGHPIMIKFFLLGKGLREDVENRYKFYLFDSETKNPIGQNIQTMLICALFSISNYPITDKILDDMNVRKYAKSIIGILHRKDEGTWTTIHPRWDMELFSFLFSSKDEDEIDDMKRHLGNACASIFKLHDPQLSLSVLATLYELEGLAGESRIPIDIVNKVVRIPDYIANDEGAMFLLRLNDKLVLSTKAEALAILGKYEESIEYYDKVLEIDLSYFIGSFAYYINHGLNEEANEWLDTIGFIDADVLEKKAGALSNLGKYQDAIECYDKALENDPDDVDVLGKKAVALGNLGNHRGALGCFDNALGIKTFRGDLRSVRLLDNKSYTLFRLNKIDEAIQCSSKAIKLNRYYANAWYNRSCYMVKKGELNEALENLEEAIRLDKTYMGSVKTDKDFDSIRNDERFKKLTS